MAFRVVYSREAQSHLVAIDRYIALEASSTIARKFLDTLVARCDSLAEFPFRGSPRDDIRQGMRTMAFRRRATIIYSVANETVNIIGVLYAGQDIASELGSRAIGPLKANSDSPALRPGRPAWRRT